jgi:hypothetical protein
VSAVPPDDEALAHLYQIYFGDMDLCGCNVPGQAWEVFGWILSLCPLYDGGWRDVENRFTPGGAHIILGVMENAGLIEHGGSIGGSWITKKGQWVLDRLNAIEGDVDKALDGKGYPHDGDSCPDECPIAKEWK